MEKYLTVAAFLDLALDYMCGSARRNPLADVQVDCTANEVVQMHVFCIYRAITVRVLLALECMI